MQRCDLIVIGAGPAGLSAAVEAARQGMRVTVYDENARPGGQLFKQIHKFFGSREHKAKIRGIRIGEELLQEASAAGVQVELDAVVTGIFADKEVTVRQGERMLRRKADTLIIATGASENMTSFENWTLPGVIGAGAAQTMMNLHGVRPGEKILMLGSGNVGLVVGFQLLQAGCQVVAVADALPGIGGYGVHAAKLARCGVPFYTAHTIVRAEGVERVTGAVIGAIDQNWHIVPDSEKHFDVDTICLAVGLSPMSRLCGLAGCVMEDNPQKAGLVPVVDALGETSVPGIFAAGDVSGIEEASSAMIEGRIAGLAAAHRMGFMASSALDARLAELTGALASLRAGMFAPGSKGKVFTHTAEGCALSASLLRRGFVADEEIDRYPGVTRARGVHPVLECTQNIPCNPCADACPRQCITVGADGGTITALPVFDAARGCTGCGLCVAACSGQAIFLVDEEAGEITLPYEFLPLPQKGEQGMALGRDGQPVCPAEVVAVRTSAAFDKTNLLTIRVPAEYAGRARFYRKER
ncbi:MAG: FAD-dependent oxidoreductase [Candidatus Margulisbacteria bacterium]|jgi:NADPH-dependent 2,4-dienoyl-CoA reductase/sulfur reductase-like enzyme/Fe-S-cluster-containing hydrogenase component 2|nr:FAD-dependent oxidoreductase [Candidatus Margulisiibacteriota bacterium]